MQNNELIKLSTFDKKEYWGEYQRLPQGQMQFSVLNISKFKVFFSISCYALKHFSFHSLLKC